MLKKPVLILVFLLTVSHCFAQQSAIHSVYFSSGTAEISSEETKNLKLFLDSIPDAANISITGHTDADGNNTYNLRLSENRIDAVQKALLSKGFSEKAITEKALGELQPISSNQSETGKSKNRRVEIRATWQEEAIDSSTIDQLFALLDGGFQEFYINPKKDTVLHAVQGTFFIIKANSFGVPGPCRKDKIRLRIKEAYKTSDMLLQNLSTTAGDELLATRGMTYIDAFCQEKKLKLKRGKSITQIMRIQNPREDLQLFSGTFKSMPTFIDWQLEANESFETGNNMGIRCASDGFTDCSFFFCKIKNFFRGLFSPNRPDGDLEFAKRIAETYGLDDEDAVRIAMEKYGVQDRGALMDTLNKVYLAETEAALQDTINSDVSLSAGRLSDFIFTQTKLGWANCDFFMRFPSNDLITMKTGIQKDNQTKSFLIITSQNCIVPHNFTKTTSTTHNFKNMPHGETATFLSLRYTNGQAQIAIKDIEIDTGIGDIGFRDVGLEELKLEIARLN